MFAGTAVDLHGRPGATATIGIVPGDGGGLDAETWRLQGAGRQQWTASAYRRPMRAESASGS
jgi:hypothetical protein